MAPKEKTTGLKLCSLLHINKPTLHNDLLCTKMKYKNYCPFPGYFLYRYKKMIRTSNFQLLCGKRVFPASKTEMIAKLQLRNLPVRILDRHYCDQQYIQECNHSLSMCTCAQLTMKLKGKRRKGPITTGLEQREAATTL